MPEHDKKGYPRAIHILLGKQSLGDSTCCSVSLAVAQDVVAQLLAVMCRLRVHINLRDYSVKFHLKLLKILIVFQANVDTFHVDVLNF